MAVQEPQGLKTISGERMAFSAATFRKDINKMATGTIKTLIPAKGFGFISTDGSRNSELFFHSSSVLDGNFDSLQVGQEVTFEQEKDPRDPSRSRAKNVRLAEANGAS